MAVCVKQTKTQKIHICQSEKAQCIWAITIQKSPTLLTLQRRQLLENPSVSGFPLFFWVLLWEGIPLGYLAQLSPFYFIEEMLLHFWTNYKPLWQGSFAGDCYITQQGGSAGKIRLRILRWGGILEDLGEPVWYQGLCKEVWGSKPEKVTCWQNQMSEWHKKGLRTKMQVVSRSQEMWGNRPPARAPALLIPGITQRLLWECWPPTLGDVVVLFKSLGLLWFVTVEARS